MWRDTSLPRSERKSEICRICPRREGGGTGCGTTGCVTTGCIGASLGRAAGFGRISAPATRITDAAAASAAMYPFLMLYQIEAHPDARFRSGAYNKGRWQRDETGFWAE